jgi:predicted HNH restriction endonuclease
MSESTRKANRKYYWKNKAQIIEQTINYGKNHPEQRKQATYKWRLKKQVKIKEILGYRCVICGAKTNIVYHEKNGLNHAAFGYLSQNPKYILDNVQNFVPLCRWCHSFIHRVERNPNINVNQLLALIEQLRKANV